MPKKVEFRTIQALVGSIVITPKEIKAFKKLHKIDLLKTLKQVQKQIYKPKTKRKPAKK